MQVECPSSSTAKNILNKNQQEKIGMVDLETVNKLMMRSETTYP